MTINRTHLAVIISCVFGAGCSSSSDLTELDTELPAAPIGTGIQISDAELVDTSMLIPDVEVGSDTEQLLDGIYTQVERTLLALNTSLSEGVELTEQQNECLAAFDPPAGQQLLAIDCPQALATGDVPIYVEQAMFYDTPECHAAIFNGRTDDCFVESVRLTVPTQWVVPEISTDSSVVVPARPQPIAGFEIYYALNGSENLRIENTDGALTGVFRCDINLRSNEATSGATSQSCASTIEHAANRFNTLLAE